MSHVTVAIRTPVPRHNNCKTLVAEANPRLKDPLVCDLLRKCCPPHFHRYVAVSDSPLYIHVEKDFQSHHMQIYSPTLMGEQERERKCVRNA